MTTVDSRRLGQPLLRMTRVPRVHRHIASKQSGKRQQLFHRTGMLRVQQDTVFAEYIHTSWTRSGSLRHPPSFFHLPESFFFLLHMLFFFITLVIIKVDPLKSMFFHQNQSPPIPGLSFVRNTTYIPRRPPTLRSPIMAYGLWLMRGEQGASCHWSADLHLSSAHIPRQ
ncbi:hypothetical protein F4861DRAFT_354251 [Xylaria intraflava]|nr:hypothetical protein F4861DRAFT_354251 [Xylaria intraflava]